MNILIVCNHFYPHNRIAAFRLNAFARYFREAGHSVTVITEGDRDETAMWNGCEVHYVKDPVITSSKQESLLQRRKKWAFRRILSALQFRLFLDYKRIWQFKACKKAQKLAKSRQFDVVLSSYGHLSSHRIAYRLHRKTPFYWIADMRDEMSKWPWLPLPINSRRLLFYERRILKDADLILSVSAPLVEDFKQIGGGIDKVIEITNGYDYEEVHDVSFQPVYTMAFIGHFYNSITPDKWFGAFSELVAEGALPSDSRILIIGNTSPLAVPENIRQNVFQIRQVDHDEAIRKSLETDTLVVVHPKGRKGVYTGKLFDYLATNKPILAICDPDDVIADLLKETRAGFTADETDNEQVKRETARYVKIPQIIDFTDKDGNDTMQQQIDANYYRIKNEVRQIVADEIERIKADPELSHLIKDK